MAIGIGSLELKAAVEAVRSGKNYSVVVRITDVLCLCYHSKSRIGLLERKPAKRGSRRTEGIQGRVREFFMLAMITYIFGADRCVPADRMLNFEIPLVITRNLHFSRIEEVESRDRATIGEI